MESVEHTHSSPGSTFAARPGLIFLCEDTQLYPRIPMDYGTTVDQQWRDLTRKDKSCRKQSMAVPNPATRRESQPAHGCGSLRSRMPLSMIWRLLMRSRAGGASRSMLPAFGSRLRHSGMTLSVVERYWCLPAIQWTDTRGHSCLSLRANRDADDLPESFSLPVAMAVPSARMRNACVCSSSLPMGIKRPARPQRCRVFLECMLPASTARGECS